MAKEEKVTQSVWAVKLPSGSKLQTKKGSLVKMGEVLAVLEEGEEKGKESKKLLSPTDGKVIFADEGKIRISFSAEKLVGEGVGEKRSWGIFHIVEAAEPFAVVSCDDRGRVIFVDRASFSLLGKCHALGIAGVVASSFPEKKQEREVVLPVLILEKKGLESFSGCRCFIDAREGQLLICQSTNEKED